MPLKIKIAGQEMTKFSEVTLKLQYDTLADTFVIKGDYNPNKISDRRIFQPNAYQDVLIEWQRSDSKKFPLITGTVTGVGLSDLPAPTLNSISGYSSTGLLMDCQVIDQPMQFNGLTIRQIAQSICDYFEFKLVVDGSVSDVVDSINAVTNIDILQTAGAFLGEICRNYNVVLSHTASGEVLLTSAKKMIVPGYTPVSARNVTNNLSPDIAGINYNVYVDNHWNKNAVPVFKFTANGKGSHFTKMELRTDSEKMHGNVYVLGQTKGQSLGPLQNMRTNPYVPFANTFLPPKKRTGRYRQRAVVNTVDPGPLKQLTARNVIADELKSISLSIDVPGWFLGGLGVEGDSAYKEGAFIRPNILISVYNPEVFLFKETTWFVESVVLNMNASSSTATLNCVLPQCFNNEEIEGNIFAI